MPALKRLAWQGEMGEFSSSDVQTLPVINISRMVNSSSATLVQVADCRHTTNTAAMQPQQVPLRAGAAGATAQRSTYPVLLRSFVGWQTDAEVGEKESEIYGRSLGLHPLQPCADQTGTIAAASRKVLLVDRPISTATAPACASGVMGAIRYACRKLGVTAMAPTCLCLGHGFT